MSNLKREAKKLAVDYTVILGHFAEAAGVNPVRATQVFNRLAVAVGALDNPSPKDIYEEAFELVAEEDMEFSVLIPMMAGVIVGKSFKLK